jgi:multicomponent Na+:H+ antiporter subunit G
VSVIIAWASDVCLLIGSFLLLTGALGFLRFADFYARIHACGVTETLATAFIIAGLLLESDGALPQFKLLLILLFVLFSSPTASHALAKAAWNAGVRPRDARGQQDLPLPPGER